MTNVSIGNLKPADCFAHILILKQTIIDVQVIVGRLKMSKLCQGPDCPYVRYDRQETWTKRKQKKLHKKLFGRWGYGNGNFCTLSCYNDWAKENVDQAIDYFGRLRERKAMLPENSWTKRQRYTWQRDNGQDEFYYYNMCTTEQRPLTEQQYNDEEYTLNT